MNKYYLASKSPRRQQLLKNIINSFEIIDIDIHEFLHPEENPLVAVKRIAAEKLEAGLRNAKNGIVISADTIVVYENSILGKPKDDCEAKKMLNVLKNNKHYVYTAFGIGSNDRHLFFIDYEKTAVFFNQIADEEIEKYVLSRSPLDKAGAYGIQDDFGAKFIKRINGCYYNVVGLPIAKLYSKLKELHCIE